MSKKTPEAVLARLQAAAARLLERGASHGPAVTAEAVPQPAKPRVTQKKRPEDEEALAQTGDLQAKGQAADVVESTGDGVLVQVAQAGQSAGTGAAAGAASASGAATAAPAGAATAAPAVAAGGGAWALGAGLLLAGAAGAGGG